MKELKHNGYIINDIELLRDINEIAKQAKSALDEFIEKGAMTISDYVDIMAKIETKLYNMSDRLDEKLGSKGSKHEKYEKTQ